MTENKDILDRLMPFIHNEARIPAGLIMDIIDEIERLRAEKNRWQQAAERFAESDPRFDAFCFYFRAVRGD